MFAQDLEGELHVLCEQGPAVILRSRSRSASMPFTFHVYPQYFMEEENGLSRGACFTRCASVTSRKLRRVLCLRIRPNEGWVDYMSDCGATAEEVQPVVDTKFGNEKGKKLQLGKW